MYLVEGITCGDDMTIGATPSGSSDAKASSSGASE